MKDERKEFLIHMYNQMFNDINRHIMVVWHSIGVLVSALAVLGLVEKEIVSLDIAVSLIVLIATWLAAHLVDAGYWYNRNLVIIANIERQFLKKEDLRSIQYYFGSHRPKNKMITHLKIQFALAAGLVLLMVGYHAIVRVLPGIAEPFSQFEPIRALPYGWLLLCLAYIYTLSNNRSAAYQEFLRNSPGDAVDTSAVEYGSGHGHDVK